MPSQSETRARAPVEVTTDAVDERAERGIISRHCAVVVTSHPRAPTEPMALAWRRPPPKPPPSAPGPRVPLPSIVVVALLLLLLELLRRRRRRDPPAIRRAPASVRSVAIYGLSANPPTSKGGHATLVRKLAEDFDEVWVLPVYSHAFAEKDGELAAYEHRHRVRSIHWSPYDRVRVVNADP